MSDSSKYQCKRRAAPRHPAKEQAIVKTKELLRAGSGGDDGDPFQYFEGFHAFGAAQMSVTAEGETVEGVWSAPILSLLAGTGHGGSPDGLVTVRGSQGVRITSGPAGLPPGNNADIYGVEIEVGEMQDVALLRGSEGNPYRGQLVMDQKKIGINGHQGGILLSSGTKIILRVAGGTSSITLTPDQIVIKGPMVFIN
jgi:hypothetical protein